MAPKYYAVAVGREPGVYNSWAECQKRVHRFPGAKFKSFPTAAQARDFANLGSSGTIGIGGSAEMFPAFSRSSSSAAFSPAASSSGSSHSTAASSSYITTNKPSPRAGRSQRKPQVVSSGPERSIRKAAKRKAKKTKEYASARSLRVTKCEPSAGTEVVWTDGSCLNNQGANHNRSAGVGVYFGSDDERNVGMMLPGEMQTNQRAEAAIVALEQTDSSKPIEIRTDSNYLVQAMTSWMPAWKRRDFENVKNKDLFRKLSQMVDSRAPVTFTYVPAHVGIPGNERADRLANEGAREHRARRMR